MMTNTLTTTADVQSAGTAQNPSAVEQLRFFWEEMSGGQTGASAWVGFLKNCFRGGRLVVAAYRCKRFWYLLLGAAHHISLLWMWPIYWWCRQLGGRHEIRTQAQIGCGFRVIHCSLACVVSPYTVAGKNLYLTGGNVVGRRRTNMKLGDIHLGDDVVLGICSVIIGPLKIGDGVQVGANATVVKSVPPRTTVVGSAARYISHED